MLLVKHRKLRICACNASGSDSVVAATEAEEVAESARIFEVLLLKF